MYALDTRGGFTRVGLPVCAGIATAARPGLAESSREHNVRSGLGGPHRSHPERGSRAHLAYSGNKEHLFAEVYTPTHLSHTMRGLKGSRSSFGLEIKHFARTANFDAPVRPLPDPGRQRVRKNMLAPGPAFETSHLPARSDHWLRRGGRFPDATPPRGGASAALGRRHPPSVAGSRATATPRGAPIPPLQNEPSPDPIRPAAAELQARKVSHPRLGPRLARSPGELHSPGSSP